MTSTDIFASIEAEARQLVGVRLFTVLAWDRAAGALHRVYLSHPTEYPTGGRKVFPRRAPWIRRVVVEQRPYLGPDPEAVAAVFEDQDVRVDHQLLAGGRERQLPTHRRQGHGHHPSGPA